MRAAAEADDAGAHRGPAEENETEAGASAEVEPGRPPIRPRSQGRGIGDAKTDPAVAASTVNGRLLRAALDFGSRSSRLMPRLPRRAPRTDSLLVFRRDDRAEAVPVDLEGPPRAGGHRPGGEQASGRRCSFVSDEPTHNSRHSIFQTLAVLTRQFARLRIVPPAAAATHPQRRTNGGG
jgi:hypothetical protein